MAVAKMVAKVATISEFHVVVLKGLDVPFQAESAPVHDHAVGVERIKNQHDDGQVEEYEEDYRPGAKAAVMPYRQSLPALRRRLLHGSAHAWPASACLRAERA
jgi:hypothetical protein